MPSVKESSGGTGAEKDVRAESKKYVGGNGADVTVGGASAAAAAAKSSNKDVKGGGAAVAAGGVSRSARMT